MQAVPAVRRLLGQARADHAAHLHALEQLVATYPTPAPSATSTPAPAGTPRTLVALRSAESAAATASAERARRLTGGPAALLASIAACEATHAELLA